MGWSAGLMGLALLLLPSGCSSHQPPLYRDPRGFRIGPPPGWVERARDDALPARPGRKPPDLPLPRLGVPGGPAQERELVRYDRLTAGHLAWLRVTAGELPGTASLKACLSALAPGPGWKREAEAEDLDVSGLPAARIAFVGRWQDQDYLCETVAVRTGEQVYLITGSFPTSDGKAREEVRNAVAGAAWNK